MIIQSLTLRNFKSYGNEQTIDLNNVDAVGISGPNGAGKSTIIEALTFALYGKNTATERMELKNEGIIRDNEDEAFVSVTFEKDGQTYTVERSARRKGTGTATITSKGKAIQAGASNATKRIESIVGMDYETFVSSTIIRQDEMDKITDLRPGQRKEILSKIFGLEFYEKLKKITHEKLVTVKSEVEASEETINQLEKLLTNESQVRNELEEARTTAKEMQTALVKEKGRLVDLEKEIKEALKKKSEYDVKRTELDSLIREMKTTSTDLHNTTTEIESIEEDAKKLSTLGDELAKAKELEEATIKAKDEKEAVTAAITENEQKLRSINETITEEETHYNTIKTSTEAECPVCKQSLDETHRKQVLNQYDSKLKELKTEHQRIKLASIRDREKLEKEITPRLNSLEKQSKEMQQLEVTKARLETATSRLPTLNKTKNELKAKILNATTTKEKLETSLKELTEAVDEYEKLDEKRKGVNESLTEITEQKGKAESSIKHLSEQLDQIGKARTELNHIKLEMGAKLETIPIYDILQDAFGKDGIPTAILKDLVPEVEEEASRILRELSNGRMNINFRFGRETRAGTQTDELVVEAEDGTGLHPVTRFSGGEKMRINLALRLGISEVIARRSGYKGKIETLIIDEGLGALDDEGRQATIEILRQLRQRFKKILVISHVEDVKDAFDTKLVISKTPAGMSVVEMI